MIYAGSSGISQEKLVSASLPWRFYGYSYISVKESSSNMPLIQEALVQSQARPKLSYVNVDKNKLLGSLISIPNREEIPLPLDEGLVVEYYAKYM